MSARFGNIRIEPKPGIGIGVTIDGTIDLPSARPTFVWRLKEYGAQWESLGYHEQHFVRALMTNGVTRVALIPEGADVYWRANYRGGYDAIVSGMMAGMFGSGLMGFGSSITIVNQVGLVTTHCIDGTSSVGAVDHRREAAIEVLLADIQEHQPDGWHYLWSSNRVMLVEASPRFDPAKDLTCPEEWYVVPEVTDHVLLGAVVIASEAGGAPLSIADEARVWGATRFGGLWAQHAEVPEEDREAYRSWVVLMAAEFEDALRALPEEE